MGNQDDTSKGDGDLARARDRALCGRGVLRCFLSIISRFTTRITALLLYRIVWDTFSRGGLGGFMDLSEVGLLSWNPGHAAHLVGHARGYGEVAGWQCRDVER